MTWRQCRGNVRHHPFHQARSVAVARLAKSLQAQSAGVVKEALVLGAPASSVCSPLRMRSHLGLARLRARSGKALRSAKRSFGASTLPRDPRGRRKFRALAQSELLHRSFVGTRSPGRTPTNSACAPPTLPGPRQLNAPRPLGLIAGRLELLPAIGLRPAPSGSVQPSGSGQLDCQSLPALPADSGSTAKLPAP